MDRNNSKNRNDLDSAAADQIGPQDAPLDSNELSQLKNLLSCLCEGMLEEADSKLLQELLRRSEQSRSIYIQYLHMHANLAHSQANVSEVHADGLVGGDFLEVRKPVSSLASRLKKWTLLSGDTVGRGFASTRNLSPRVLLGLAALLFGVAAFSVFFFRGADALTPFSRSRVQYVARVVRDVDCRWGKETVAAVQGGLLQCQDELNLLEGLAKLRFDCGAEIILRGPAKLRIDSGMSCFLDSGELSAIVPEVAHGFTVDTPLGRVVDLGTAFGVNVEEEIEVQVFEGELELHPESRGTQQVSAGPKGKTFGMLAGAVSSMSLDEDNSAVRVLELPGPLHEFARSLPQFDERTRNSAINALAVDSFGQGGPGTRLLGRNGGFGWDGPWINTPDSNSVSFLLGTDGAISRGSGSGVVERLLGPGLASAKQLYFSAEFQVNGPDTHCSAWLGLFKFIPHYWSNGDTNLAVIGLTDGQFSGRLAPFQSQEVEQALGDCGPYAEGSRHLIVGKLEFDAVGDQERLSVWINPTLADESTPDKVIVRDTGRPGADAIAIRCWEMDNETVATFDEVRVGRNWIDVVQ